MRRYAQVSLVLGRAERAELERACEILKWYLASRARQLVVEAYGRPVLISYSSDGTPIKTQERISRRLTKKMHVQRVGGAATEYLIQQCFVRYFDAHQVPRTAVVLRDPLPLTEGKSAWAVFAAGRDFFPTLVELGHTGISVVHVVFDRALFAPLRKHFSEHLELCSRRFAGSATSALQGELLPLLQWFCASGCSNHDVHNSMKWAMHAHFQNSALLKEVHIGIESLRNAYTQLHDMLSQWLTSHIRFEATGVESEHLRQMWTLLGVEPQWADTLADLGLHWRKDHLYLLPWAAKEPDMLERVSTCLLHLWRFARFSDSRWCTVGTSCRSLHAGLLSGVHSLVASVLANPSASKFYLGGFQTLSSEAKEFVVVAGLAAYPSDAVLAELLEDDRVSRRLPELERALQDEIGCWGRIPEPVWDLLGSACGKHGQWLRAVVVRAGHVSAGFISTKLFREAREGVWGLLQGSVQQGLERLALQEDEPRHDLTLRKIWRLARLGYNTSQMVEALELLRDVSWSIASVEQQHASAAVTMRAHDAYGRETLCCRALVHSMRQFFSLPVEEQQLQGVRRQMSKVLGKQKRTSHISGRQAFAMECMEIVKGKRQRGKVLPHDCWRRVMKFHAEQWRRMDPHQKARYEAKARLWREEREDAQQEELEFAEAQLTLEEQRVRQEEPTRKRRLVLSQARFDQRDRDALDAALASKDWSATRVCALRRAALVAPSPPPRHVQEAMTGLKLDTARDHPRPEWLKIVAKHRRCFEDCALIVKESGHMWKFVYATMSPYLATFSPMFEDDGHYYCASSKSRRRWELASVRSYKRSFQVDLCSFVLAHEIGAMRCTEIEVLPGLVYMGGGAVSTDWDPLDWGSFITTMGLESHAEVDASTTNPRSAPGPSVAANLLLEHPWLEQYQSQVSATSREHLPQEDELGSHDTVPGTEMTAELDEEAMYDIFKELAGARERWQAEQGALAEDFKTCLLGGAWTQRATGQVVDYVCAKASNEAAETWCERYGLQKTSRYSLRAYGDRAAGILARCWAHRMQYYFDVFLAKDAMDYCYTPEDHSSYREPLEIAELGHDSEGRLSARIAQIRALRPSLSSSSSL